MSPEHEMELKRVDAMIQIVGALDKMTGKLFAKLAITPLEELEAQLMSLINQVKDNNDLRKESLGALNEYLLTLGCLIRFRDDLILNIENAKECWDKSADIRNLLKDIGGIGISIHVVNMG